MEIHVDIDDFTLAEAEDLEAYTGMPILRLKSAIDSGEVGTKLVTGLLWIMRRRDDPSFTIEQARALKFSEIQWEHEGKGGTVAAEPADAASPGSAPSSSSTPASRRRHSGI